MEHFPTQNPLPEEVQNTPKKKNWLQKTIVAGAFAVTTLGAAQAANGQQSESPNQNKTEQSVGQDRVIDTLGYTFAVKTADVNFGDFAPVHHKTNELWYKNQKLKLSDFERVGPVEFVSLDIEQRGTVDILTLHAKDKVMNTDQTHKYMFMPGAAGEDGKFIIIHE